MGGDDEVARSDGASTEPEKQDTTEKVQEEQPEKEVKKRKAMAPRSEVWESFIKITVRGEHMKAKCKYCSRELKCSTKTNDKTRREMGYRMLDKYYKYWGDNNEEKPGEQLNLVIFFCVAIDPRYKLSNYTKMATFEMFGLEKGLTLWDKVNYSFRALFDEYRNIYASHDKPQQSNDSQGAPERTRRLMRSLIAQKMRLDNGAMSSTKSELEKYLAEENEEDKDFDILEWWKDNANRFPVLSRMAHDLLAIPISTVASESAFSTGGRVLDDFRSSLTPQMVERLICTQDWLRSSINLSVEEDLEELAKLEEYHPVRSSL
ncbi:hypothetical protein E2562_019323 [Oryza meyeriana var. granulata]|uniref:HAT C-terminal dimerisation domain-containing protein n=1 Tax=Oryza meyeriana var. granulata TaxID=110450 RepID=A0A6G1C920_9ORYZ|nr:hypothetical protein E2562_019323 [Oryza meyeriana var. granulata]